MGDCLLLTSPIRALKEEFPGFRISVLVESRFAPCFDGNPDIAEVMEARSKFSTAARLLTRRFDAIVNLHGGPTSLLYSCLTWGKRIGGEHYQGAKPYRGIVPRPEPEAHTVDSTRGLMDVLGGRREDPATARYAG